MPLSPGTRLGVYEILSLLGRGGMGEVWRANDTRVDRPVALKVLPEDFLEGEEREGRFGREAKLLASLNHPGIATLYSFEEISGRNVLTMELVEGADLSQRLASGSLPLEESLSFARQVAEALAAAHEKGIVHRDLKPANVKIAPGGRVKLLDFGLAKRSADEGAGGATSAPTESKHTEPGIVMGTAGYMSPEQVRGLPVDHRSDIFSFGAMLYEMLSGRRAFQGETAADTMSAILREEPPDLAATGRDIPPALAQVVRHCLEKNRDDRFQSAKDVLFALGQASGPLSAAGASGALPKPPAASRNAKALVALGALALLTFMGILLFRRSTRPATAPAGPKRIAVLPFENLGAAADGTFADGMTLEVRSKLSALPGLAVIASASSDQFKATTKPAGTIAKELGVGYLLTAKLQWQKAGTTSRIRVTPELVEAGDSGAPTTRWQEAFEADVSDVFRVQGEIAAKVAKALDLVLSGKDKGNLAARPTSNLEAWEAFLKGKETFKETGYSCKAALPFYERAVAMDATFATAWSAISECHSSAYVWEPSPAAAEAARAAAEKAVQLAPALKESLVAQAAYLAFVAKDVPKSEEIYARLLREYPGDVELLVHEAESAGRSSVERSYELYKRVDELDPLRAGNGARIGLAAGLLKLHRPVEARAVCDRGLAISRKAPSLVHLKAMTFLQEGDLAGARAVIAGASKDIEPTRLVASIGGSNDHDWLLDDAGRELLLRLTPSAFGDSRAEWAIVLAQAASRSGDAAKVRELAEEARKGYEACEVAPDPSYCPAYLGLSLAYLGRKEEAIREGERAVALTPVAKDKDEGPYVLLLLVRIHILCGNHEKALDLLEELLKTQYFLTPGWLRVDPNFDPLRQNSRFRKLAGT